jgi:hypothetical protein
MGSLLYKGHTIVTSAIKDEISGTYNAVASISWDAESDPEVYLRTNPPLQCATADEAHELALEAAKAWVDKRLSNK